MKTADMTKESPAKLLLQFVIPILIGNLFQQAYTLADRIIVGRFVGDTAFSAIGATNALSMMFMSMCMGAAMVTYMGQNIGAGKQERISYGVIDAMKISAIVSIALLAVSWIFGRNIMGIFVTNTDIISIAASGIRITSLFLNFSGRCADITLYAQWCRRFNVRIDERSSRGYCKSCFCRKSYFNTFYRYVGNLDYNRAHMDGYSCLCIGAL